MTAVSYAHPAISRFPIADGILHIGGLPIGSLAEPVGATPFFAHECTGLTRRVEELRPRPAGRHPPQLRGQGQFDAHLCTLLDLLARGACPPRAEIGDLVAVFQAGAYDGAVGVDRRPPGLHDR